MAEAKNFRVPFGLDTDGHLIPRLDAVKGATYVCPSCRDPLIFRAGARREKHFSHRPSATCAGETVVHRTAKMIVKQAVEEACGGGPGITLAFGCRGCRSTVESALACESIKSAALEQRLASGRVVDVLLSGEDGPYLGVEIHVSHAVDAEKAADIGVPWIELEGAQVLTSPRRWEVKEHGLEAQRCRRCAEIEVVRQEHVAVALQNAGTVCPPGYSVDPVDCYKCGLLIPIFRWGGEIWAHAAPPEPRPPTLQQGRSRVGTYWANICPGCRSLQGDWHLRTSLGYYIQDIIEPEVDRRLGTPHSQPPR